MRSRDSGQRIPYFGKCKLTIKWMSNIKDVRCKPWPRVSINLLVGVCPLCCATSSSLSSFARPRAIPLAMITTRKPIDGIFFFAITNFQYTCSIAKWSSRFWFPGMTPKQISDEYLLKNVLCSRLFPCSILRMRLTSFTNTAKGVFGNVSSHNLEYLAYLLNQN